MSETVIFTSKELNVEFTGSLQELIGLNIGLIDGFSYGKEFDNANYLTKDYSKDAEMLIKKLLNKRHDVAIENKYVIKAYASKLNSRDELTFLSPPIHTQSLYVGFSKTNELGILSNEFSKHLADFKNTQAYKEILIKYNVR